MGRIPVIFAALAGEELRAVRGRIASETAFGLFIALCLLIALGFGVALGVVALAQAYGTMVALAAAAGIALALALIGWGWMTLARRRAARAAAARRANQARALRLALIEAAPYVRYAPLLAFGAALFAGLNMGRKEDDS